MRWPARDPKHHGCVDRQAYHSMGALVLGWALCSVLEWLGCPVWLMLVVLLLAFLTIPLLHLAADSDERRRAGVTDADKAAGRW